MRRLAIACAVALYALSSPSIAELLQADNADLVKLIEQTGVDAIDVSGQQFPGDPLRMHIEKPEDQSYFEDTANPATGIPGRPLSWQSLFRQQYWPHWLS